MPPIVLMPEKPSDSGDLFGELICSFFGTLGYAKCRLNVHKSGRELDLDGSHELEARRVVAECKATTAKSGGDQINKFVGVLDAEKRKATAETIGYFVSLSGFTETAIEQERAFDNQRVILVTGQEVVDRLVAGNIIVPESSAFVAAGTCKAGRSDLQEELECQILGHRTGFIWAVYFTSAKLRTHFCLIHADGSVLNADIAYDLQLIEGSPLKGLTYLPLETDGQRGKVSTSEAEAAYFSYIESECGEIQLEGLPADQEVGSKKLNLESIFVPSHLIRSYDSEAGFVDAETGKMNRGGAKRIPAGEVLRHSRRMAILGLPGSGKSTLLKRLATAYAFPDRKCLVADDLPEGQYLPLFIRCRQLIGKARSSIIEILEDIVVRGELGADLLPAFSRLIQSALRSGEALLLIDGLDEISDPGDRLAFVRQLRLFLHRYPSTNVIITSREAGFRIVAATLRTVCDQYVLADFDDDDISRLTVAWHREIVGSKREVEIDAIRLASLINFNHRVRQLAGNPLLLTTLLLVKRWLGSLPTKRSVLYAKAIEVLLATWNVEGHEPLEQDEVLPQLEYVAFSMLDSGNQQIDSRALHSSLDEARAQMPELLAYSRIGSRELIDRVELRSSLLIQSGLDLVDGTILPVYEFRHLTFQEYLAARAIVQGHYPAAEDGDSLSSILLPFIGREDWKEAIALALVLAGRRSLPVVEQLIELVSSNKVLRKQAADLLTGALIDEVLMPPDLIKRAIRSLILVTGIDHEEVAQIAEGKYCKVLEEVSETVFREERTNLLRVAGVYVDVLFHEHVDISGESRIPVSVFNPFIKQLEEDDWFAKAHACLHIMEYAWLFSRPSREHGVDPTLPLEFEAIFEKLFRHLWPLISSEVKQLSFTATWAMVWIVVNIPFIAKKRCDVLPYLVERLVNEDNTDVRFFTAWTIGELDMVEDVLLLNSESKANTIENLKMLADSKDDEEDNASAVREAAIIVLFYLEGSQPWLNALREIVSTRQREYQHSAQLLKRYGEPNQSAF